MKVRKEVLCMSRGPNCPKCGFISRPSHSDGETVTYVCERCNHYFSE